jgi:hypothetical protein
MPTEISTEIQLWPIDKLVLYAHNPRKNDAAVDRMCDSIQEYGFKIPCLVRGDGEVIDGHLRLKAARRLGLTDIPVILCDEWTPAQVKAFRIMVNRSATWADWDDELLAIELTDLKTLDYDLALTGFDTKEIDDLLLSDAQDEDAVPPMPIDPVSRVGDLWLLGSHRVLCGDATDAEAVARLLGDWKPRLMVCDPPYGISLDSEWRDRAGRNTHGRAEPSYLKKRTRGHTETMISGDTRADWSEAFALVPSLEVAYVWHASVYAREVLNGLERIGFLYPQQIIWNKGRAVMTRTHYWYSHEPCAPSKGAGRVAEDSDIEQKRMPVFALVVGKNGPKLRPAAEAGEAECHRQTEDLPARSQGFTCRNVTLAFLAKRLRELGDFILPAVAATGLTGSHDIDFSYPTQTAVMMLSYKYAGEPLPPEFSKAWDALVLDPQSRGGPPRSI